jgi:flagellar biosynthesis/type III secretory pathway protein FliH
MEAAFAFDQLPPAPVEARRIDAQAARNEAEQIVATARLEADSIRERAYAEGVAAGRAEASAQAAPAVQALGAAIVQVEEERIQLASEMEEAAVSLALQIADKALTAAITAHPERVVDVVRGALRCLVERERVTILVHPDDMELVREATDGLVGQLGGIEHIDVQEERRMGRGGAIVRSTAGEIDARVETKLERAREILREELTKQ